MVSVSYDLLGSCCTNILDVGISSSELSEGGSLIHLSRSKLKLHTHHIVFFAIIMFVKKHYFQVCLHVLSLFLIIARIKSSIFYEGFGPKINS